jgi:hypothetical protein
MGSALVFFQVETNWVDAAVARVTVSKNAPAICSPSFIFSFLLKICFG